MNRSRYRDNSERISLVKQHEEEMTRLYSEWTEYSVTNTVVYDDSNTPEPGQNFNGEYNTEVILVNTDTVSGLQNFASGTTTVLNFASYKRPGGGYMRGMTAQEEDLCFKSNLYQVLKEFEWSYYAWNNMHLNGGFYTNRALFSPSIIMGGVECNVLTCAAPNASRMLRYNTGEGEKNRLALVSRVLFFLNIAAVNKQDTLILGAFGCGVFKQDPVEVAKLFWYCLNNTHKGVFKRVVFAIPDENSVNYQAFKEHLGYKVKEIRLS